MLRDFSKNAIKKYNNDLEGYEKFFTDNYQLKPGVYIKLKIENNKLVIDDELEITKEETTVKGDLVDFFKYRDRKSFIEDSNKTIDKSKKIYSTNIFSFSVKLQQLNDEFNINRKKPLLDINYFETKYIDLLFKQKDFFEMIKPFENDENKLKKNIKLYNLKRYFENEERKELFDYLKLLYLNSFYELKDSLNEKYLYDKYKETFFKFYLEGYEKEYDFESDLYIYSFGFIKNRYNFLNEKDLLVGIQAHDLTVNDKKPFMLHRTRFGKSIPETILYNHIPIYKDVYNYIIQKSRSKDNYMDIDFTFHDDSEFKNENNTSFQIYTDKRLDDIEIVNFKKTFKPFILNNYLDVFLKVGEKYNISKEKYGFKELFFKIYMYEKLDANIPLKRITTIKSYNYSNLTKNTFFTNRDVLHNFFYLGHTHIIKNQIEKIARSFVEGLLITNLKEEKYFRYNMIDGINMYISLLKYFNLRKGDEIIMNLNIIKNKLHNMEKDFVIESLSEFCYFSGVVGYYLASQTEAQKRTYQLLEGIYNASTIDVIKNRLSVLFNKYNHKINLSNTKFRSLFSSILEYTEDIKNIKDYKMYIYAGSLSDNVLYKKKEEVDLNE